jgi:hypothetical protein
MQQSRCSCGTSRPRAAVVGTAAPAASTSGRSSNSRSGSSTGWQQRAGLASPVVHQRHGLRSRPSSSHVCRGFLGSLFKCVGPHTTSLESGTAAVSRGGLKAMNQSRRDHCACAVPWGPCRRPPPLQRQPRPPHGARHDLRAPPLTLPPHVDVHEQEGARQGGAVGAIPGGQSGGGPGGWVGSNEGGGCVSGRGMGQGACMG